MNLPIIPKLNLKDWYWVVGNSTTQVYSSARNTYVPLTDSAYVSWSALGNTPTSIPNEAQLWSSVGAYFSPTLFNGTTFVQPTAATYTKTQLIAYAAAKQQTLMVGGTLVAVGGGVNIECSTDPASLVLLQGANTLATSTPATTFNWVQTTGAPVSLTSAQINTMFSAVTAFVQATFTQLSAVINAINAGTITTTAQVDTPPSPIPAWPVNS